MAHTSSRKGHELGTLVCECHGEGGEGAPLYMHFEHFPLCHQRIYFFVR